MLCLFTASCSAQGRPSVFLPDLEQKGMTEAELFELGYEVEAVYPTENFFLRNDSVIFQFNPYDIAPYAEGPQQIALKRE